MGRSADSGASTVVVRWWLVPGLCSKGASVGESRAFAGCCSLRTAGGNRCGAPLGSRSSDCICTCVRAKCATTEPNSCPDPREAGRADPSAPTSSEIERRASTGEERGVAAGATRPTPGRSWPARGASRATTTKQPQQLVVRWPDSATAATKQAWATTSGAPDHQQPQSATTNPTGRQKTRPIGGRVGG